MNTKKQQLVATALDLFYLHGVNPVGINQVLQVSGVAKKTLYHHFASKEQLILATLALRDQHFITWLSAQLAGAHCEQVFIEQLFNALDSWINNKSSLGYFHGCFFVNTAAEFAQDSQIAQQCLLHKQQVRQLIADSLPSNNQTLIEALCLLKEGAINNAFVANDKQAAIKALAIAKLLLSL